MLVGALAVACGADESEPGAEGTSGTAGARSDAGGAGLGGSSAGGSGGSAGASGAAGIGGASGASAKARGAFSLHIVPGEGCTLPEQWLDYPVVEGGHPVTATEAVELIEDGATAQVMNAAGNWIEATVSRLACTWVADPGFDIHVGFRFGPAGNDGTLSMSADTRVGQASTEGILLVGPDWDERNYSGQCTYTALVVDEATRSVRGTLTCPDLGLVGSAVPETCTVPEGYFAFENCPLPE
jgi:hypothetical protein